MTGAGEHARRLSRVSVLVFAGLVATAAISFGAAAPPAGAAVSPSAVVVSSADVGGLAPRRVSASARRLWLTTLPSSTARIARRGLATRVFISKARTLGLVARVIVVSNARSARSVEGVLRRAARRATSADSAALGLSRARLRGAARAVWRQQTVVGELVWVGHGGHFARGVLSSLVASSRAKAHGQLSRTAFDTILDRVRPDGSVDLQTALQAFALTVGPIPGVQPPSGVRPPPMSGDLAIGWLFPHIAELSAQQRAAVEEALPPPPNAFAARRWQAKAAAFTPDAGYQADVDAAVTEISAQMGGGDLLGFRPIAGVGDPNGIAWADTGVYDASGGRNQANDPASDEAKSCAIVVTPVGRQATGVDRLQMITHEVFHCFEGKFLGIHRFWWARPAKWRMEGLASWAACNLHPSPTSVNTTFWVQPHFVEHPETRLFARTYDALAWFQHIEGRAIGLWRRWPSVITAGADEQAYTQAVDGIEADVLDTLGASFAFQPHPPWSELWRMGGQCPGLSGPTPQTVAIDDATAGFDNPPPYTSAILRLFSVADVLHVQTTGHARLGDGAGVDTAALQNAYFCTNPRGSCRCPKDSSPIAPTPPRLKATGGEARLGVSSGRSATYVAMRGLTLKKFCRPKKKPPKRKPRPRRRKPVKCRANPTQAAAASTCRDQPADVADDYGDPHITTFDGLGFDFNVAGEYMLARSGRDLEIQGRQEPRLNAPHDPFAFDVSINTAVAMRVGRHRVGLYAGRRRGISLHVDGRALAALPRSLSLGSGAGLTVSDDGFGAGVRVSWPDGTRALLRVSRADTRQGISVTLDPSSARRARVTGVFGNDDGTSADDMAPRGSRTQGASPYGRFARSWHVTRRTSLFDYARGKSTRSYDRPGFPRRVIDVTSLSHAIQHAFDGLCRRTGANQQPYRRACVFDVGFTGDKGFARQDAAAQAAVKELSASPVPTHHLVNFDGIPDGTLITTQTEAAGAVFGSPAELGFGMPAPRFVCPVGPTAQGGTAVAARCPSDTEGLSWSGVMARLTSPARSLAVLVGATQALPGGSDLVIKGYDALGQQVSENAELVASTAFGDPRTGAVHQLKLQVSQGAVPISFIALYFDGASTSGVRVVFDDLDYSG